MRTYRHTVHKKAALLRGAALLLAAGAFLCGGRESKAAETAAVSVAAAVDPNAAAADPNAAAAEPNTAAVDPNAAAVDPNAAATDPNAAAVDPNAAAADPNAAATDPNAATADPNAAAAQPSGGAGTGSSQSREPILTEQIKKDIESAHKDGAQEAIINGYLSLLNGDYILEDELDIDLVSIGNGHRLERRAAAEITQMVKDAKKDGMSISITSSYRTYLKQVSLFKNKIQRLEKAGRSHAEAVEEAGTVVAVPGTSEHQLGLTIDFVTSSYKKLDEGIRDTKEYQWTAEHAWEYGYVIRYPKDKLDITGIISEPWHLRYVGIPAAKLMTEQNLCLEEFLGVAYDDQRDGISYGAGWVNTGR